MTQKELQQRLTIGCCARGQFEIEIEYRNKTYRCKSNNTLAYDCLHNQLGELVYYSSIRQAMQALYDECKQANGILPPLRTKWQVWESGVWGKTICHAKSFSRWQDAARYAEELASADKRTPKATYTPVSAKKRYW